MTDARRLHGDDLAHALRESRAHTLALAADLSDVQWQVPCRPGLNPLAWELAHVAWFAEFWVLRGPHWTDAAGTVHAERPPRHAAPDALLDSARLPHAQRWTVPLPSRAEVEAMLQAQLEACLAALPAGEDDDALYAHRLALMHEDMHGEALLWLRQALAYPAPAGLHLPRAAPRAPLQVRGGGAALGWPPDRPGFAFDNELLGCVVPLADFEIDAQPLSAGEFLRFVEAGGYDEPALWPGDAGRWRAAAGRSQPAQWRRAPGSNGTPQWQQRWFDRWTPLDPDAPVIHVNAWEAEAYCRWAGRRLPSAAEWTHAAVCAPCDDRATTAGSGAGDAPCIGTRTHAAPAGFAWGHSVWEWTSDVFTPYPGFAPGPYRDYSAPWFGTHRELRGGAFATPARLHDPRYRNFFLPDRCDVFTGFRTAAPRR